MLRTGVRCKGDGEGGARKRPRLAPKERAPGQEWGGGSEAARVDPDTRKQRSDRSACSCVVGTRDSGGDAPAAAAPWRWARGPHRGGAAAEASPMYRMPANRRGHGFDVAEVTRRVRALKKTRGAIAESGRVVLTGGP